MPQPLEPAVPKSLQRLMLQCAGLGGGDASSGDPGSSDKGECL
jgi:hypothetical protein